MTGKLRRIHALNTCYTIAEITRMRNKQRVFKNISAFWQPAEKEIGAGIFGAFIISEPALPFVSAQNVYGFQATGTHIFHVYIFHIAVCT